MGKIETPYFYLNPRYERYELGYAELQFKSLPDAFPKVPQNTKVNPILFIPVLFVILLIGLAFVTADSMLELILVSAAILIGFILVMQGIFSPQTYATREKFQRLRQTKQILDGELIKCYWRGYDYTFTSWSLLESRTHTTRDYVVLADYKFVSPESGQLLTGTTAWEHRDWDTQKVELPPPGTPVRVLYADDDAHLML